MAEWSEQALYVALDTSMLWDTYCLIRLSVIYRGRAVPLVWCVLEQGSAQVSFDAYKELLEQAALLLPRGCKVVFLADRGFADTELMAHLHRLGWHWRIRIKSSFWLYRCGRSNVSLGHEGRPLSGIECASPKSAMGRCIWPWLAIAIATSGGMSSAMNRPMGKPSRNMDYGSISKRTFWTINPMDFNWNPP